MGGGGGGGGECCTTSWRCRRERGGGVERRGRRWMGGDQCGAGLRGERERRQSSICARKRFDVST